MSWFRTVEDDVVSFIKKAELGFQTAEKDAKNSINWIAKQTPVLAQNISLVSQFIAQVPVVGTNPEVMAGIAAANLGMQGLNVLVQTLSKASTGAPVTPQDVTSSYAAYNDVKAATRQAMSIAIKNTTTAKATS